MPETREHGLWWLPGHEANAVAGILVIPDDAFPRLELIGALHDIGVIASAPAAPIILGVAGGKNVTLMHCLVSNTQIQMPGLLTEKYVAHFVLRGAHFPTVDAVRFSQMEVQYDALFEWAGVSGITLRFDTDAASRLTSIKAGFAFPETPTFSIDGARLSVVVRASTDGGADSPSLSVHQHVSLAVATDAPMHLEEYLRRYLLDLANFLTLGAGAPVRATRITGILPVQSAESRVYTPPVEVIFRGRDQHVSGVRRRWDMLFTLGDLSTDAQTALQSWYARAEVLRSIYDLYFGAQFQESAYLHQRFLTLAQALESYHRCTRGGQHLPQSTFDSILQSLSSVVEAATPTIGKDVASAFLGKLRYFNEVSLRRRLKELVHDQSDISALVIRSPRLFIDRVVNTRNYYTHYDASSQKLAVAEGDLHLLTEQMKFLLELCLLSELGLSRATIAALVARHERFAYLARAVNRFDPAT